MIREERKPSRVFAEQLGKNTCLRSARMILRWVIFKFRPYGGSNKVLWIPISTMRIYTLLPTEKKCIYASNVYLLRCVADKVSEGVFMLPMFLKIFSSRKLSMCLKK